MAARPQRSSLAASASGNVGIALVATARGPEAGWVWPRSSPKTVKEPRTSRSNQVRFTSLNGSILIRSCSFAAANLKLEPCPVLKCANIHRSLRVGDQLCRAAGCGENFPRLRHANSEQSRPGRVPLGQLHLDQ